MKFSDTEYNASPWEWRILGVADPGSGGSWGGRTLGVADPNPSHYSHFKFSNRAISITAPRLWELSAGKSQHFFGGTSIIFDKRLPPFHSGSSIHRPSGLPLKTKISSLSGTLAPLLLIILLPPILDLNDTHFNSYSKSPASSEPLETGFRPT